MLYKHSSEIKLPGQKFPNFTCLCNNKVANNEKSNFVFFIPSKDWGDLNFFKCFFWLIRATNYRV